MIPAHGSRLEAAVRAADDERLEQSFDAIVVGGGAAGGMASLLLTEAGMQVLVLDAGWPDPPIRRLTANGIRAVADPRLQNVLPPRVVGFGRRALRAAGSLRQQVQTRCFAWEMAPQAFVDDRENPYGHEADARFDWFRARQLGGRMTIPGHGRQYYRLAEHDFHPDDGLSPDWPLAAGELDPWYSLVERRLGLTGSREHSPWVPDGEITHPLQPSPAESELIERVGARWPQAGAILGRAAPPLDSLEQAAATGRLHCRMGAVAGEILTEGGKASGAAWFDRARGRRMTAKAPLVFLCASALESVRILLNSPDVGRASGVLGRGLMDHVVVSGEAGGGALPGEPVPHEPGRCVYLPRFDRREGGSAGRGYGVQVYRWSTGRGRSYFNAVAFAEMAPREDNRVILDPARKDAWGWPTLHIACRHSQAEKAMAQDQLQALRDLGEALGVRFFRLDQGPAVPGTAIHECGAARMGRTPETSVLDPHNQCWDVQGLYVTDASAFPSQGAQNPTLTLLALTARACAQAAGQATGAGRSAPPQRQDAAE